MSSCQCVGIESMFDKKTAAKELKRYRRKGPIKTTRLLIEALKKEGIDGTTLLDIGGGVGAIQHELLKAGAGSATSIDGSSSYLEAAREEAERQGFADRVHYHHGDFVERAPDTEPADMVTLDRVICCYHDMRKLVGLSAERARKYYGVVYPRDKWWTRLVIPLFNLIPWVKRSPFRVFVHPTSEVESIIYNNGFRKQFYDQTFVWQVALYTR